MAMDGNSVAFSPLTASGGNTIQMNAVASPISVGAVNDCAALGQLTATGSNTVTYEDAFANTDLVYVLENGALKEYIILRSSNASSQFSFLFTLNGLTLETVDDNAYLTDGDGNIVFALSDLFAIDANGVITEDLSYSFTPVKGTDQIIVTVILDESYLLAEDRVFPVIIDPTLTISSVETMDACVCSYYPTTNYRTAYQLRTGMDTDYGIRRSYIKFDIPDSVPKYGVQMATLEVERVSGADPTVRAYQVTGTWNSATITWNNKAGYTTTGSSTLSGVQSNGTWCTMYVTDTVKAWVNGESPNYGFVLIDRTENNSSHWTTFYSSDASSPHKPELNITYVERKAKLIGVPDGNHDHASCLTAIQPYLLDCGLTADTHFGTFTEQDIDGYLSDNSNKVFVSRSHGDITYNHQGTPIGTYIDIGGVHYTSTTSIISEDLSNMTLIAFIGCYTGAVADGRNLPSVAVSRGATTAIGFREKINCDKANAWTVEFFGLMEAGKTVQEACMELTSKYKGSGLDTHDIYGNMNTRLNY